MRVGLCTWKLEDYKYTIYVTMRFLMISNSDM